MKTVGLIGGMGISACTLHNKELCALIDARAINRSAALRCIERAESQRVFRTDEAFGDSAVGFSFSANNTLASEQSHWVL